MNDPTLGRVNFGAGCENRTRNYNLEGCRFTTKLIPHDLIGRTLTP